MSGETLASLTEDQLDVLVSVAIIRAETLDETQPEAAAAAWREVLQYEKQLAELTGPAEIPGGVARVGAVAAALAAGDRDEAIRLSKMYRQEPGLPMERRAALDRAFDEDRQRLAHRFPALAKSRRLDEVEEWRLLILSQDKVNVFPKPV